MNHAILFDIIQYIPRNMHTVPALLCFAVLCCGYTLTDFPISIRLTSLALWQSNDCPSASKTTLMNMDKYFMWIHYERLHNHITKQSTTKPCAYFLGYTVGQPEYWCQECVWLWFPCGHLNWQPTVNTSYTQVNSRLALNGAPPSFYFPLQK